MRGKYFGIASFFVLITSIFLVWGSTQAQAATDVKGFAWSSNIGWISFNSLNCDANADAKSEGVPAACPAVGTGIARYGITLSAVPTGTFAGFAWSSNIGWVSFSETTGCPSGACGAVISNGTVGGWAKGVAAEGSVSGWNGWIHLSNASPAYGPTLDPIGKFIGYSWGENVVGWIKWNPNGGGVYIGLPPTTTPTTTPPVASTTVPLIVLKNGSGLVVSNIPTVNGINCGSDCSERYASSTKVTLLASNNTGYEFASWGAAASTCASATTCIVTVGNSTTTVIANFNPILQVAKVGSGTITSSPSGINCGATCSKSYVFGTHVTLTATPDSGFEFLGWGGAAASCGTNLVCVVTVSGYTSVTAAFSSNTGILIVTKPENGAIAGTDGRIACGNTCQATYTNGTVVTLRAVPDIGYEMGSWTGAASSCGSATTCNVTVSGTTNVSVIFVQIPQCRDGQDNDNDGKTDAADPGCHSDSNALNAASYDANDNDETNAPPATLCTDGLDNDHDGRCDFNGCTINGIELPPDPECSSDLDMTENPSYKCSDKVDNDGDGKCDYQGGMCLDPFGTTCGAVGAICQMPSDFPECNSPYKNTETVDGSVIEY